MIQQDDQREFTQNQTNSEELFNFSQSEYVNEDGARSVTGIPPE